MGHYSEKNYWIQCIKWACAKTKNEKWLSTVQFEKIKTSYEDPKSLDNAIKKIENFKETLTSSGLESHCAFDHACANWQMQNNNKNSVKFEKNSLWFLW